MNLHISKNNYENIINHCIRKLKEDYIEDETKEQQAFGAIIGEKAEDGYKIKRVEILKKNYRFEKETSKKMNDFIEKFAIPGGIEVSERAWSIDPIELSTILTKLSGDEIFLGTYHMHSYLSWSGDYPKELPTKLDRELNIGSELINLIVHIGKEDIRGIRAFYESDLDQEYNIMITEVLNEG